LIQNLIIAEYDRVRDEGGAGEASEAEEDDGT